MKDETELNKKKLQAIEDALDERKMPNDRRRVDIDLPPELERRSGADRRASSN